MITKTKRPFFSATRRNSAGQVPAYKSFLHHTRFLLIFVVVLLNSIVFINSILINFAVICWKNDNGFSEREWNMSNVQEVTELREEIFKQMEDFRSSWFTYTPPQLSLLFSIPSLGTLLCFYPFWILCQKYGYRRIASISGVFSSIFIAFIPWAAYFGYFPVVLLQFLQGCTAPILLIPNVIRKWSTRKNDHFCFLVTSVFMQFSPVICFPIFAYFASSPFGWPSLFYLQFLATISVTCLFFYFYKESPIRHGNVSEPEIIRIFRENQSTRMDKLCIETMFQCPQFRSIIANILVHFLVFQTTLQYSFIYFSDVFKMNLIEIGWSVSGMMLVSGASKLGTSWVIEHKNNWTTHGSIRVLASVSSFGSALMFLICFSFELSPSVNLVVFLILSILTSLTWPSVFKASQIVSGQYYLPIMVRCFLLLFVFAGILSNIFHLVLIFEDDWSHWRFIWLLLAVLLVVSNLYFIVSFRFEKSNWEVKKKKKIEAGIVEIRPEEIAPVSHPRPCEFSASFNDQIVVSIISRGLDRCDTCKKHGIDPSRVHPQFANNLTMQIPTRKMFDEILEPEEASVTHM